MKRYLKTSLFLIGIAFGNQMINASQSVPYPSLDALRNLMRESMMAEQHAQQTLPVSPALKLVVPANTDGEITKVIPVDSPKAQAGIDKKHAAEKAKPMTHSAPFVHANAQPVKPGPAASQEEHEKYKEEVRVYAQQHPVLTPAKTQKSAAVRSTAQRRGLGVAAGTVDRNFTIASATACQPFEDEREKQLREAFDEYTQHQSAMVRERLKIQQTSVKQPTVAPMPTPTAPMPSSPSRAASAAFEEYTQRKSAMVRARLKMGQAKTRPSADTNNHPQQPTVAPMPAPIVPILALASLAAPGAHALPHNPQAQHNNQSLEFYDQEETPREATPQAVQNTADDERIAAELAARLIAEEEVSRAAKAKQSAADAHMAAKLTADLENERAAIALQRKYDAEYAHQQAAAAKATRAPARPTAQRPAGAKRVTAPAPARARRG